MKKKIKTIVTKFLKKYNTRIPYYLADSLDIVIVETPLGNLFGAYKYINRNKVIWINSSLSLHMKKLVVAHELWHVVLHTKHDCNFLSRHTFFLTAKVEIEANFFAAFLLINDNIHRDYPGETLEYIALMEDTPLELLELKASYERQLANF